MQIEVNNSFCRLKNTPKAALEGLKNLLSYTNESVAYERQNTLKQMKYAKSINNNRMLFGLRKKLQELPPARVEWLINGSFPTGHLPLVEEFLSKTKIKYALNDIRERPTAYNFFRPANPLPALRYYQHEIVDKCKQIGRGAVSASVGSGKSYCILKLVQDLGVNALIVVPSTGLVEQLGADFNLYLGEKYVDLLDAKKVKAKKKLKPVRIITIQSLASLTKSGNLDRILGDIDMFILDEAHRSSSRSYLNLLQHTEHVYYRFSFSGSYLRTDGTELDLWGFAATLLYHYPPKKARDEGFICHSNYNVVTIPGKAHKNYQREYALNYLGSKEFLKAIIKILNNIPTQESLLILVSQKEKSGEIISNYLKKNKIEHCYLSGDDKKSTVKDALEAYNQGKIKLLIATKILGEGISINQCQHLILAGGGKSTIQSVQNIGRAVRLHPGKKIANIYDIGFSNTFYLEKHALERVNTYREWFDGEIKNYDL